jgi:crotonobetainyl-CoA:carnitine CoA-transferase CaiB-like acyl-CoA transferase
MVSANPDTALQQILAAGDWQPDEAEQVHISGKEPVYASDFAFGTAGAAALGAVGLAAAALWEARGGKQQTISVSLRHAALSLKSGVLLRIDGEPARDWDPLRKFYQTADGRWVYIHTQFDHFKEGVCALLECQPDPAAVAQALKGWDAQTFEDAMAANNLCGAMIRNRAQWLAHPQSQAVSALPLLEICKIADSDPEPLPAAPSPLSDIRVLDLTRVIAGPTSGRTLAQHGASVMRISAAHLPFIPGLIVDTGFGKQAAELDLRSESARRQLDGLIANADVFTQSYRPGSLRAKGYTLERMAEIRPGIVTATLSAWSHTGPWADRRGFDSIVACATGLAEHQGTEGVPGKLPCQPLDYVSGYLCAFGIMTALKRRAEEGGSYEVRVSLAQTAEWIWNLGLLENTAKIQTPGFDDVGDLMAECDSAFGRLTYMKPVIGMEETPPTWKSPPVPLGTHKPEWD